MCTNVIFEEYLTDWKIEKNVLADTPVPEGNCICQGPSFDSLDEFRGYWDNL